MDFNQSSVYPTAADTKDQHNIYLCRELFSITIFNWVCASNPKAYDTLKNQEYFQKKYTSNPE